MGLSIPPHRSDAGLRALHGTTARVERTTKRLATGRRIVDASDDAAGLAIAQRLAAQVRSKQQGERNLADGQAMAATAESALQGSHDAIARMQELAVQARNGTLSPSDRSTLQQEYDQLVAQIDQTAAGTRFGATQLLDGSASGADAVHITDGDGGDHALDVPDLGGGALGVAGLDVADPATADALAAAAQRLSSERSRLGSLDNRLQHHGEALAVARIQAESARSRIEDADFAEETAALTRDRILQGLQLSGLQIQGREARRALDLFG
jgi:flagellin